MYKTALFFISIFMTFSLNAANFVINSFDEPRQVLIGPQGQQFHVFEVIGDGDCCFHIFGNRQEIYNYVINHHNDGAMIDLLTPEAKDWYAHEAVHDDSKVEINVALNETNLLTPPQLLDFMYNRYFINYPTDIIPNEKYLACLEESGHEEETPTGLLDVIARLKQLNINVWRESDIGLIPMRQILIDPALRTVDLFLNGMHYKQLVTQDFYENAAHDAQNLERALENEKNWYKRCLANKENTLREQEEILYLIENDLLDTFDTIEELPKDFDPFTYLSLNQDLKTHANTLISNEAKINFARSHYLKDGKTEKRPYIEKLPTDFNPFTYISLNPDLEKATEKMTTIMEKTDWAKRHYLHHGKTEKRKY